MNMFIFTLINFTSTKINNNINMDNIEDVPLYFRKGSVVFFLADVVVKVVNYLK